MEMIPPGRVWSHNQALMELGALICLPKATHCAICPVSDFCEAFRLGAQEELPVKAPRKEQTVVRRNVYLFMTEDGRVLLRMRERGEGLLEGLWEFPGEDADTSASRPEVWGVPGEPREVLRACHAFTHRIWEMRGLYLPWPTDRLAPCGCRLVTPEELAELPLPNAMRAFRKLYMSGGVRGGS